MINLRNWLAVLTVAIIMIACQTESSNETTNSNVAKDVNVDEFETLLNKREENQAQLIDVRTPPEIGQGNIEGAVFFNIKEKGFEKSLESLDKSKPVLVYCKSGGRSGKAMEIMQEMGFMEVYNLEGGITAWNDAEKPIANRPKF